MKPNLPDKMVGAVLVDKNISDKSLLLLDSLGIKTYFTKPVKTISDSTSTHPDMQFAFISDNTVAVCEELVSYYKNILPMFRYVSINGIRSPYPNDCKLNFTIIGDKCFKTKHHIDLDYNAININQGYSKCNICILNKNTIISGDMGIVSKARENGINAHYLEDDEIALCGYKNGFWGGCSGLIDKDKLFFNGNIEKLSCYNKLISILDNEKIEPIYSREVDITDIGSIIPLY